MSRMRSETYPRGYFENAEGSNYTNYGDDPGWVPTIAVMKEFLKDGASVAEIASAKGFFVHHARRVGLDAWGIDISEYAVSCVPGVTKPYVQHGNVAEGTNWQDGKFDAVCSWEFLEHVYEDELWLVLKEMERIAKPGAMLWHRIGIDVSDDPRFAGIDHGQHHDSTHVCEKTGSWWRDLFESRGWKRMSQAEERIDQVFEGRDWAGRFFVYGYKGGDSE